MKQIQHKIDMEKLYHEFGETISRVSRRMISNSEIAKEAAQEVWCEIIKSVTKFQGNSSISTWIYTIARRTILRYAQSERVLKEVEINDHFEMEAIKYIGNEKEKKEWIKEKCDYCLTAFCHCLTTDARLIFLFRDLADLKYYQISRIMETSEENIRKISSRSRKKVKKFMTNNCILYNPSGNCKCLIRKEIISIDLHKEYQTLLNTERLVDFYNKFDEKLPLKNYWEKILIEGVTN